MCQPNSNSLIHIKEKGWFIELGRRGGPFLTPKAVRMQQESYNKIRTFHLLAPRTSMSTEEYKHDSYAYTCHIECGMCMYNCHVINVAY